MQYYTERHRHTCGVDLHGRNLYLCVLNENREIVLHRRVDCDERKLLRALAPYREDLVIGVECMFKWYWLSDICEEHGIPFVLGHALEMKAVHGRKSGNDKLDAMRIARLLGSGMFPVAYVYPKEMRSTRDLARRRSFLVNQRSSLINHIQVTNLQTNLPELGRISNPTGRLSLSHFHNGVPKGSPSLLCPSPEPEPNPSPITGTFQAIGQTVILKRTARGNGLVSGTGGHRPSTATQCSG